MTAKTISVEENQEDDVYVVSQEGKEQKSEPEKGKKGHHQIVDIHDYAT